MARRAMACAMAAGALTACNSIIGNGNLEGPVGDGGNMPGDGCSGIGCMVTNCAGQAKPPTSVSGIVRTPDEMLPVNNALVYIPTDALAPIIDGPAARGCASGAPFVHAFTDVSGHFKLVGVPSVANLRLVIQVGKWRREITIPAVTDCGELVLSSSQTRLPRSSAEGHLPHIAVTTGTADALECIGRRVGISDSEFSRGNGTGRIHLYAGAGSPTTMLGSETLEPVAALSGRMSQYDMLLFSCDGRPVGRPPQEVRDFIDDGGWVWLSHLNANWLAQPAFPTVATFDVNDATQIPPAVAARIDTATPKGQALADWMAQVGAASQGQVSLETGHNTCSGIETAAQRLVYFDPPVSSGLGGVQLLTWAPGSGGRLWFADFHFQDPIPFKQVFPTECESAELTPEGKLIAFQLFDQPTCLP